VVNLKSSKRRINKTVKNFTLNNYPIQGKYTDWKYEIEKHNLIVIEKEVKKSRCPIQQKNHRRDTQLYNSVWYLVIIEL